MNTKSERLETTRLLAKAFNINDFLDPTRLAHDELQYYNTLTRAFDKTVSKYIDWLETDEAREVFYQGIQDNKEYFTAIDKDIDDIIRDTSLSADGIIEKIYRKGLNQGYKDINRRPVFNDASKYGLKATQEYNFELITNVSDDLKNSIKHHIFRGVAEGQTIHEVAGAITDSGLKPLEGKSLSAYQRASLIARTEIARSMTTGRLQAYANYGVEKVKILTAGDDKVCPICLEAAHVFNGEVSHENIMGERVYDLDNASDLVPFHPACRCTVIAHIEHGIPQTPLGDVDSDRAPKLITTTPKGIAYNERNSYLNRDESQKIAEDLGFKYEYDEKNHVERFIDEKFGVVIEFGESALKTVDRLMFGVGNNIQYTKRDILNSYVESPEIYKQASTKIIFKEKTQREWESSKLGFAAGYFNPNNQEIVLYVNYFATPVTYEVNPKITLRHEMIHALDFRMNPDKFVSGTSQGKYGLSVSEDDEEDTEYEKVIKLDKKFQEENFPNEHIVLSSHDEIDKSSEDMAVAMAILSFENCEDQSPVLLVGPKGKKLTLDQWIERYPNRYNYYHKIINNLSVKDFKK